MAMTAVHTISHFLVDFACTVLLFAYVVPAVSLPVSDIFGMPYEEDVASTTMAFVLYNFMAFVLQLPLGWACGRGRRTLVLAAAGCAVVAISFLLLPFPFVAAAVSGLGNAMFHVGAGASLLALGGTRRADLSGVFVSTGALGLFLGTWAGTTRIVGAEVAIIGMTIAGISIVLMGKAVGGTLEIMRGTKSPAVSKGIRRQRLSPDAVIVMACMLSAIVLRSYLGFAMAFPWQVDFATGLVSTLFVVIGKAAGGIVGDSTGWKKVMTISLAAAAASLLLSYDSMACGLLAIALFNMTMPITLVVTADILEPKFGVAFGLTTVALFVGALPKLLGVDTALAPWQLSLLCGASLLIMREGLRRYEILHAGRRRLSSPSLSEEENDG